MASGVVGGAVGWIRVVPGDDVKAVDYFEKSVYKVSFRSSGG